jgi:putative endonuclease
MTRRETGILGEKLAADFLREKGYAIHTTNYRCAEGEIDIIAEQGDCLVFVEVRARKSRAYGSPEESITPAKMKKLREVASRYLQDRDRLPAAWRIDVVAIELNGDNSVSRIGHIENAVGGE